MSIFIFIATLIVAYFIIRIGAVAFELTGLSPEQAYFQALSAFTRTGFTTRESELIVVHQQRRKIASTLMIFGNAGFVTLIATLVNSTRPDTAGTVRIIPGLEDVVPAAALPYINLLLVLAVLYMIYRFLRYSKLLNIFMSKVQQKIVDKKLIHPACFEELLLDAKGYGVSQIEITDRNPLVGKTLSESKLREHDILVLSVERGDEHLVNPSANIKFRTKDVLVCFGKIESIRETAYEEKSA